MNRIHTACVVLLATSLLAACSTLPDRKPNLSNPIRTIAVLPLVNNTNDVEGPFVVRTLLASRLGGYFYSVKPLEETDAILANGMGITLGSQLDMVTTAQLCEKLAADALLYGSLEDFSQKITGIYNNKRVRLRVKIDSCKTNSTVWKNGVGVKRDARAGDNLLKSVPIVGNAITVTGAVSSVVSSISDKSDAALPAFRAENVDAPWQDVSDDSDSTAELNVIFGIGGRIVNKALNSPLLTETEEAVEILLHGQYDDGNDYIPYGSMIPPGPVVSTESASPVVKK